MKIQRQHRRKFFWLFAAAAVCALLFTDQVAVLYVLSTLAMCGLFIVVAFSNLKEDAEMQVAAIREPGDQKSINYRALGREGGRGA